MNEFGKELTETNEALVLIKNAALYTSTGLENHKESIDQASKTLAKDISELYSNLATEIRKIREEE